MTEIAIGTDVFDGSDTVEVDNFEMASPVPIPAAVWLFLTGISGLGFLGSLKRLANLDHSGTVAI